MPEGNSDRLDRIERILEQSVATQQNLLQSDANLVMRMAGVTDQQTQIQSALSELIRMSGQVQHQQLATAKTVQDSAQQVGDIHALVRSNREILV
ncbi:MAG: hypothetical protein AAF978_09350, partial [Cyanobacteria bacterium P01_E01_bin.48]